MKRVEIIEEAIPEFVTLTRDGRYEVNGAHLRDWLQELDAKYSTVEVSYSFVEKLLGLREFRIRHLCSGYVWEIYLDELQAILKLELMLTQLENEKRVQNIDDLRSEIKTIFYMSAGLANTYIAGVDTILGLNDLRQKLNLQRAEGKIVGDKIPVVKESIRQVLAYFREKTNLSMTIIEEFSGLRKGRLHYILSHPRAAETMSGDEIMGLMGFISTCEKLITGHNDGSFDLYVDEAMLRYNFSYKSLVELVNYFIPQYFPSKNKFVEAIGMKYERLSYLLKQKGKAKIFEKEASAMLELYERVDFGSCRRMESVLVNIYCLEKEEIQRLLTLYGGVRRKGLTRILISLEYLMVV